MGVNLARALDVQRRPADELERVEHGAVERVQRLVAAQCGFGKQAQRRIGRHAPHRFAECRHGLAHQRLGISEQARQFEQSAFQPQQQAEVGELRKDRIRGLPTGRKLTAREEGAEPLGRSLVSRHALPDHWRHEREGAERRPADELRAGHEHGRAIPR
jgi:hypothetical protein